MSHEPYFIHPNPAKEHMICTPDGGVLECKHEAAAQRVCQLLNEMHTRLTTPQFSAEFEAAVQGHCARAGQVDDESWIPGELHPQHPAVYQRRVPPGVAKYSYWDGAQWRSGGVSPQMALDHKDGPPSAYQNFDWGSLL